MSGLQFTSIFIKKDHYSEYSYKGNTEAIDNLSQINIFIGVNNSGKSRFMRKILMDKDIAFRAKEVDVVYVDNMMKRIVDEFVEATKRENYHPFGAPIFEAELRKIQSINYLKNNIDHTTTLRIIGSIIQKYKEYGYHRERDSASFNLIFDAFEEYNTIFENPQNLSYHNYSSIYIPTLRGLRPIQSNGGDDNFSNLFDNYLQRTKFDYFNKDQCEMYTGLNLYRDLDEYSRGEPKQRDQLTQFKNFLSRTFFNNEHIDLTARFNKNVVYVRIGNHEEPIYNLGDGIQALIIMTYPLFFNQDKFLKIFIEEPETHLHPGYQRILIETLLRKEFSHFQYFITTHSNHFLDMTLDSNNISVYTFEQAAGNKEKPEFTIANVENSDTNILALIGVQNSSVFLSNCTIWVEGITDRIYIRKYLEILQKDKKRVFHEDTHFSFVEYAGNNITHWSFLDSDDENHHNILVDRLCGKLFLITDKDNTGFDKNGELLEKPSKKAVRLKQLQDKLGDRFYCLEVKEIENLLMPNIIANIVKEYEKKEDVGLDGLAYDAYKAKGLGNYLNANVKDKSKNYASESGTIAGKVDFAKKAVEFIETKQDMSAEAIAMAEKIYAFIESMNK